MVIVARQLRPEARKRDARERESRRGGSQVSEGQLDRRDPPGRWSQRDHVSGPARQIEDPDDARGRFIGRVATAALLELRVEEDRAAVVPDLEALAGSEPLHGFQDSHHRERRLESPDVQAHCASGRG